MNTAAVIAAAIGGFCLAWGIFLAFWRGYQLGLHTKSLSSQAWPLQPVAAQTAAQGREEVRVNRYKKLSKKAKGALIVGSCLAAGAAFAWSTGGDGVFGGSFQSAPQPLHAVASYPSSQLAPSGTADVEAVISNPNSGPITLHTVTLTSPFTGSALFLSDCKGHVGFNKDTFTGLNVTIPGNGQATVTLPNAMAADADTPETCEGVQFQVPVGAMTAG